VREKAQGSLQPGQEGPLRGRLFGGGGFGGFGGGDQQLIASHAHWATILEYVVFVFAIVLVLALAAERAHAEQHGFGRMTTLFATVRFRGGSRILAAVLAAVAVVTVVHVGDLGAKAVWANRLNGPGGGIPSFGNGGGGGTGFGGQPGAGSGSQGKAGSSTSP